MQYNELLQLIDRVDKSTIAYVDFKTEGAHVILGKEVPSLAAAAPVREVAPVAAPVLSPVREVTEIATTTVAPEEIAATPDEGAEDVVSPMIGVVYLQESPDADPYVQVGDRVNKGDVVCIIEAMKLMNEIHAPISGVVTEILVENESVVEYGQPLIRIK